MEIKQKRCIDLALAACRKRQSPRTGFVHAFEGEESMDTIPLYENFCFAAALYRQKTVEAALEGKSLLEKLFAFQAPDGNFPVYIHEYPRCRDVLQRLKIAPLLLQIQSHFAAVLSLDLKKSLADAIEKSLAFSCDALSNIWKERYQACKERAEDKIQSLLFRGLAEKLPLFHPQLQMVMDLSRPFVQEGFEPRPNLLEWLFAEQAGTFSSRLLKDHPLQMHLAPFGPLPKNLEHSLPSSLYQQDQLAVLWNQQPLEQITGCEAFRLLWKEGEGRIGSFVLPGIYPCSIIPQGERRWEFLFDLPEGVDLSQNHTFEVRFYASALTGVNWSINGQKANTFSLGDEILLESPHCRFSLSFALIEGSGDFCGHLFKANRPNQKDSSPVAAYDWQIGLRTLRRTSYARIQVICCL